LQIGVENKTTQLTLLVGWVDQRIARRGLGSVPSVLEQPGTNIDLVFKHEFQIAGNNLTLGLSGRNLLDEDNQEFQLSKLGRTQANTYQRGRSFSLSLTFKR
jgi:outer membrane receptor protein involved in Fe transport